LVQAEKVQTNPKRLNAMTTNAANPQAAKNYRFFLSSDVHVPVKVKMCVGQALGKDLLPTLLLLLFDFKYTVAWHI